MLRLPQKKLTPVQLEFIKHLLLVATIHSMLLAMLIVSRTDVPVLLLNVRTFQHSHPVTLTWRSVTHKSSRSSVVKTPVHASKPVKNPLVNKPQVNKLTVKKPGVKKTVQKNRSHETKSKKLFSTLPEHSEHVTPKKINEPIKPSSPQEPINEPLVLSVQDYAHEKLFFEIVDAVKRWWQPPLGIHPDALCVLMVKVSASGTCQAIVVQQSSGIPAYDISAKRALVKSKFPHHLWGKECVFQF